MVSSLPPSTARWHTSSIAFRIRYKPRPPGLLYSEGDSACTASTADHRGDELPEELPHRQTRLLVPLRESGASVVAVFVSISRRNAGCEAVVGDYVYVGCAILRAFKRHLSWPVRRLVSWLVAGTVNKWQRRNHSRCESGRANASITAAVIVLGSGNPGWLSRGGRCKMSPLSVEDIEEPTRP